MRIPSWSLTADLAALPWRSTKVEGVSWLPLHLEEGADSREGTRRGGGTVLVRMDPGRAYTPHRHVGPEDVLVLQGGYRDERGEHRSGDHVHYPAGTSHAPRSLGDPERPAGPENPACVLYTSVPGGIELLESPEEPEEPGAAEDPPPGARP